ncbi:hypothetical protein [Maricaulis sp.]|uniref:hypothetical protein n=1 Tax=Maricaulis sp. TaxID=1486257 RepID=UPI001AFE8C0F|nr:hypothetical protein [Maricaulis sp.]MBO6796266.1 hypothetical protein [Maricaulis sp.]
MEHAVIERFKSLDEAYLARAPKSERMYARFAALSSLNAKQDVECLIERVFEARDQLNDGLGAWKAPAKAMRLVFAAALVTAGRSAKHFFDVREGLKERRKARGSRHLSQGGSCAALALLAAGGHAHQADHFYDNLDAIAAPWWRREPMREEVLAAAFTALGETPEDCAVRLDRTREALRSAGIPKSHADAAAYEVALLDTDYGDIAASWTSLNLAVRGRSSLRHGVGKTGLAVLAAQGDGASMADALVRSFETIKEMRPRVSSTAAPKIAMRLAQMQMGDASPVGAAADLAAILAAQAAMVAAITAASSSAAVATTAT